MAEALETIGTVITGEERRDAVHIAVEPARAAERLFPGQHVGRDDDGNYVASPRVDWLGIVDPFLDRGVMPGERFWLFVYPRTITNLRHVWTHPAFEPEEGPDVAIIPATDKERSEAWLRAFCEAADCPHYEIVLAKALEGPEFGDDFLLFRGQDAHGEIPPEFWDHVEVVAGEKIPADRRAQYFSCSC